MKSTKFCFEEHRVLFVVWDYLLVEIVSLEFVLRPVKIKFSRELKKVNWTSPNLRWGNFNNYLQKDGFIALIFFFCCYIKSIHFKMSD